MHALLVTPSIGYGGAELHCAGLYGALIGRGYRCTISWEPSKAVAPLSNYIDPGHFAPSSIAWHRGETEIQNAERQHAAVAKLLADISPDFVIVALPDPAAAPGIMKAISETDLPRAFVFHYAHPLIKLDPMQSRAYHAAFGRKAIGIAVSPWLAKTIQRIAPFAHDLIHTVNNTAFRWSGSSPLDPWMRAEIKREVFAELGLKTDNLLALTVARLEQEKGYDDLLVAIHEANARMPDIRYLWVGDGSRKETLDRRIGELGLSGAVIRMGHVEDPSKYYIASDFFLLPTYIRGDALTLDEAASFGLPIITTDVTRGAEFHRANESALILKTGDTKELAAAIQRLAGDRVLQSTLAKRSLHMAEQYSAETMWSAYLNLFEKLCTSSN